MLPLDNKAAADLNQRWEHCFDVINVIQPVFLLPFGRGASSFAPVVVQPVSAGSARLNSGLRSVLLLLPSVNRPVKLIFALQYHQQGSGSDKDTADCRLCGKLLVEKNEGQNQCNNHRQFIDRHNL